jgi:hypothetical protein
MKRFCLLLFTTALLVSCSTDDSNDPSNPGTDPENFDRGKMLSNWADNIIIPSLVNFESLTSDLDSKTQAFIENPTMQSLSVLRQSYQEAYLGFQKVSLYQIGPAESMNFRSNLNTYPTDKTSVEEKINSGEFNLELSNSLDQQGFPALDLLLNGMQNSDAETIEYFANNADAREYLNALSERINTLTASVLNQWEDSYRDDFVGNTSSSSTGSIDKFTNDFIFYFEKLIRTAKIGIPAGAFTGSPHAENVESYYDPEFSKELYTTALTTVEDFFKGKHVNGNETGPSFQQYLNALDSKKNGEQLSSLINDQFQVVDQKNEALNPNLVQQVNTNPTTMLAAFDEMQKNVILLKVDMLQELSIGVDYGDTDGD